MEWIVGLLIAGFLYYKFVMKKAGNLKFWKVAQAQPEEAYAFFKQNSCFVVFEGKPPRGYRANLPWGEWDGPFKFPFPSQKRVLTIYGHSPEYQIAQNNFLRSHNG